MRRGCGKPGVPAIRPYGLVTASPCRSAGLSGDHPVSAPAATGPTVTQLAFVAASALGLSQLVPDVNRYRGPSCRGPRRPSATGAAESTSASVFSSASGSSIGVRSLNDRFVPVRFGGSASICCSDGVVGGLGSAVGFCSARPIRDPQLPAPSFGLGLPVGTSRLPSQAILRPLRGLVLQSCGSVRPARLLPLRARRLRTCDFRRGGFGVYLQPPASAASGSAASGSAASGSCSFRLRLQSFRLGLGLRDFTLGDCCLRGFRLRSSRTSCLLPTRPKPSQPPADDRFCNAAGAASDSATSARQRLPPRPAVQRLLRPRLRAQLARPPQLLTRRAQALRPPARAASGSAASGSAVSGSTGSGSTASGSAGSGSPTPGSATSAPADSGSAASGSATSRLRAFCLRDRSLRSHPADIRFSDLGLRLSADFRLGDVCSRLPLQRLLRPRPRAQRARAPKLRARRAPPPGLRLGGLGLHGFRLGGLRLEDRRLDGSGSAASGSADFGLHRFCLGGFGLRGLDNSCLLPTRPKPSQPPADLRFRNRDLRRCDFRRCLLDLDDLCGLLERPHGSGSA